MDILLDDLLSKAENLWLEFKCCWKDVDEHKVWGEFLKDFASLFNTYTETNDTKYLIIGFDEETKKCQNYNENNGRVISVFRDIEDFKLKVVKKLKNHFRNVPVYRTLSDLPDIETYFQVHLVEKNGVKVLVFKIIPSPYLLELKKQLQGNETFRDGNIITRDLKHDGTPEIINAPSSSIDVLKRYIDKNRKEKFPEKRITIEKIVTVFKNKYFPSSNISCISEKRDSSSGVFFEIYSIVGGDYSPTIDFIYFSKNTTQSTSVEYIVKNNLLDMKNKKIILTDERNRNNGVIDVSKIKRQFNHHYSDVEVYYIEQFSYKKLYNDLINEEIFYQEKFNIKDFIQPYTDKSREKTADLLLKEWYQNISQPLVVLKGVGGIGKTTVVKYFLDNLYKMRVREIGINILFINSHDLIHDIMKNPKIDNLFDFYRILAEKYHIEKKFDKKNLELSIDDGNVLMILDGLDEVIMKVGSNFNVVRFIESIFSDYSSNMGKAKIIITCRDYFWDKTIEYNDQILTLSLKPFSKDMAKEYFSKHFNNEKKVEKAITLAEEFSITEDGTQTYIPYILDMIKEDILTDSGKNRIESDILLRQGSINDFIVGKVCEREIIKLDNLSIDRQIELFMDMALKYDGVLDEVHLKNLENKVNVNLEKFRSHPLLEYSLENNKIKFRYDFFNEYFKNIKLALFLKNDNLNTLSDDMIDILIQHISYDGSLMKDLNKRLEGIDFEEMKLKIFTFLKEELYCKNNIDKSLKNRINSSLFVLLLVLGKFNNKEERTELLKEIYEDNSRIIKLCLINLHGTDSSKILFDFSDLYFEECYFENFENFTECSFSKETFFSKSNFISPLHRKGINTSLDYKNFDQSEKGQCNLKGIIDVLEQRKKNENDFESDIRNILKKIFRLFWQNSSFRQKQKDEIRKKMKNNNDIVDILLKNNILEEVSVVTKQKRNDKAYRVNEDFSNLRKVMEENNTCSEFEFIVSQVNDAKAK